MISQIFHLQLQCNHKKTRPDLFDTIDDILRSLSLGKYRLKDRNAPIGRIGNRRVKTLNILKNRWNFRIYAILSDLLSDNKL